MPTVHTTEFTVDLDEEGQGDVIITDARLLVQPRRVPGQYPASVGHDTGHAASILALGNDGDTPYWHIISPLSVQETDHLLDRVFYAYVDGCCLELWCDAIVSYIVNCDENFLDKRYGFEDGSYTMHFNVYCGISPDKIEEFLPEIVGCLNRNRYIVVRPDSTEQGFVAQGFETTRQPDNDDQGEPYDEDEDWYDDQPDEEDEDPLAGDVDPTGGYYEAPMHPFDAHRLSVMRQYGDYTG